MIRYKTLRERRKLRQRFKISRVAKEKYRLLVHRTNNHMYAQILDKNTKNTIITASTLSPEIRSKMKYGGNIAAAELVGELVAKKAKEKNISEVVFDRSGFLYHGRVKALAENARKNGLKF